MLKKGLLIFLFSCFISGITSTVFSQETNRTVKVTFIKGDINVKIAASETEIPAKIDMVLTEGDNISVPSDGQIILAFEDGSTIEVNENSVLSIKKIIFIEHQKKQDTQLILWVGNIVSKIKTLLPQDKFQIYTPSTVCSVRGTEFSVLVYKNGATTVSTINGLVGVREISGLGKEVLVKAGEQTVVKPNTPPTRPQLIPSSENQAAPQLSGIESASSLPSEDESIDSSLVQKESADIEIDDKEEKETPSKSKTERSKRLLGLTTSGALGTVVLTNPDTNKQQIYSQFSILPEFSIGKFGIGLDIALYFDENSKLRDIDWDNSGDIINKIWYVRYGQKKDTLFAYLGGFKNAILGHGLIISRYSNMLQYPDLRKIGAELDIDLGLGGFESLISDVSQNGFLGGRAFFRPLYNAGIPLLRNAALGFSAATDQNPDLNKDTKKDTVTIYGLDLDMPIFDNAASSMLAYVDSAEMDIGQTYISAGSKNKGRGYAGGLTGKLKIINIHYRGEYRRLDNNFISSYFDSYYEIDRSVKGFTIAPTSSPIKEGPYLELGYNLLNAVNLFVAYENYDVPKDNPNYPYIHGEMKVDPSVLMNKYSLLCAYDKRDVEKWEDLEKIKGPNTIITTEIGYFINPNISLILIYQQMFDLNGTPTKTTAIQTRFQF